MQSTRSSWTGKYLYSDSYTCNFYIPNTLTDSNANYGSISKSYRPNILTYLEAVPCIGDYAGMARIVLAIIHIAGHSFAALIFWDKEHLPHVAKGGAELLRGIITATPIIGRCFAIRWIWEDLWDHGGYDDTSKFFLIKIYDPNQIDYPDLVLHNTNAHPYLN